MKKAKDYDKNITVDMCMEQLGISTYAEMSRYCGITEKTLRSWKRKLSPLGTVLLNQLLEIKRLEEQVLKCEEFRIRFGEVVRYALLEEEQDNNIDKKERTK